MSVIGLRPARCLTCGRKFYTRYTLSEDGKYVATKKRGSAKAAQMPSRGEQAVRSESNRAA